MHYHTCKLVAGPEVYTLSRIYHDSIIVGDPLQILAVAVD